MKLYGRVNGEETEIAGGGGGGDESDIQVFKSTDFEPLTYVSGNTTYYCPRVTFPGSSKGKILGIKAVDSNGITRTFDPTWLMHLGMNLFSPMVTKNTGSSYQPDKIFDTSTNSNKGVTITYLGDGGYSVTGTSTDNEGTVKYVRIGTVVDPVVGIWGAPDDKKLPLDALDPYIRCKNISGTYDGLTIGGYSNATYCSSIDEEVALNKTQTWNSSTVYQYRIYYDIYLGIEGHKTYDCTFYPQIIPKAISYGYTDYAKYEKPFCLNNPYTMTMPIATKFGLSESIYTYLDFSKSGSYVTNITPYVNLSYQSTKPSSTYRFATNNSGNASTYGVINYPIVHSGINTFVYGWPTTDADNILQLEVYYDPDYQGNKIKDNLAEIEYSVSNGHSNIYGIFANLRCDQEANTNTRTDNKHYWIENVAPLRKNNPYLPNGILVRYQSSLSYSSYDGHVQINPHAYSVSGGGIINYGQYLRTIRSGFQMGDFTDFNKDYNINTSYKRTIYYPSSEFYWSTPASSTYTPCLGLPLATGTTFTSTEQIQCGFVLDYDGWDDSPSFEQ